jgi:hypothetical protein
MSYLSWKGTYSLTSVYQPGDIVYHIDDELTYVCVRKTHGIPPYITDSGFELMVNFSITKIDGGEF